MDEIVHVGNWHSGRYPRGSGQHPHHRFGAELSGIFKDKIKLHQETFDENARNRIRSIIDTHAQKNQINRSAMAQGTKQARQLLKIRKENDKIIREGLKKLSSMTPEEAAAFTEKMKRFNTADMITEEHMRSIAETKISTVKVYTAKMDFLASGLKTLKTGISVAQSLKDDPQLKNLSETLDKVEKSTNQKAKALKDSPENIAKYTEKYVKLTGASKERAQKEVINILAAAKHEDRIEKMFKKAIKNEKKKED